MRTLLIVSQFIKVNFLEEKKIHKQINIQRCKYFEIPPVLYIIVSGGEWRSWGIKPTDNQIYFGLNWVMFGNGHGARDI